MKLVIHSRFHRSYSRIKHRKTNGTGVKVKSWTNKDLRKWIASSLGSGRESRKSTIPRRRSLLLCSPFFQTFLCPSCPNTVRLLEFSRICLDKGTRGQGVWTKFINPMAVSPCPPSPLSPNPAKSEEIPKPTRIASCPQRTEVAIATSYLSIFSKCWNTWKHFICAKLRVLFHFGSMLGYERIVFQVLWIRAWIRLAWQINQKAWKRRIWQLRRGLSQK